MAVNHKRADFLASKFWIFFHFGDSLTAFPESSIMLAMHATDKIFVVFPLL